MSYVLKKRLCPPGLRNNPNRDLRSIDYITVHCTGNYSPGAAAKNHADFLYNGSGGGESSWHYTVDKDEVWQSFEDHRQCWHAGDGNGPGNTTSIAIEICVNDRAGFPRTCDNAAQLVADLLRRHGLGVGRIKQHRDWSGKLCPAELWTGDWGVTWKEFLDKTAAYLTPAPVEKPSPWAREAWEWAVKNGITDGSDPLGAATREMAVQMIYNATGISRSRRR